MVRRNIKFNTPLFRVRNIRKFFGALEGWCHGDKVSSIRARLGIAKDTWRSYKTVIQNVVDMNIKMLEEAPDRKLGGRGIVVEVDECHLHTRKYNRGQELATESIWAVGLIERTSDGTRGRKAAFFITKKRGANELVPSSRSWLNPCPS